jgi:hypothetical protein
VGYVEAKPLAANGRGLAFDITARIARPMGLTLKLTQYQEWEDLVAGLRTGEVDISAPITGPREELIASEPIGLALRHVILVKSENLAREAAPPGSGRAEPVFLPWKEHKDLLAWLDPLPAVDNILNPVQLGLIRFLSLSGSEAERNFRTDNFEIMHAATEPTKDDLLRRLDQGTGESQLIDAVVCDLRFARENLNTGRMIVALPHHLNPSTAMTFLARPGHAALIEAINARLAYMRRFGELDALIRYTASRPDGLEGFVKDPELKSTTRPNEPALPRSDDHAHK